MTLLYILVIILSHLQHTVSLLTSVPGLYLGNPSTIKIKPLSAHTRAHPTIKHPSDIVLHLPGPPLYPESLDTL
jgi:hypothetical protein